MRRITEKGIVDSTAPEGFVCPKCKDELTVRRMVLAGAWSGIVWCKCGYKESVTNYLMGVLVTVQPLRRVKNE